MRGSIPAADEAGSQDASGDHGKDEHDHSHVGCQVDGFHTKQDVTNGASTEDRSRYAERHSRHDTPHCGHEHGSPHIAALSADRQANGKLVPPLRDIEAHEAERGPRWRARTPAPQTA